MALRWGSRAWRPLAFVSPTDSQVVATICVRVMIVAGGFVASVLTARWLSPGGRGEYFLIVTAAQTIAQFGNCGLQASNTYLVARDGRLAAPLLANSAWLSLVVGCGGSIVLGLVLLVTGQWTVGAGYWFVVLLAPATLFYMLGSNLLVGMNRIHAFNAFQLGSSYGVLLCLGAAAVLGAGPKGFLAASALAWTVVSCIMLLTVRRDVKGSMAFNYAVLREGLRYAAKAYVVSLCGFIVVRSNVFLLTALKSVDETGYYSVASQVADVIGILPQSMALVLFPALVTATGGRLQTTLRSMLIVGVLVAIGCTLVSLCAAPFVGIVFGVKFAATVPVLRWMLPGVFFLGLTAVLSQYLAALGFPASLVVVWIAGAVMSVGLGWWLVPWGGGAGAAIALSITHAAVFAGVLTLSLLSERRAHAARLKVATDERTPT